MSTPAPPSLVIRFGADADPAYITYPVPLESQVSITPGAASFETGFPPLNMTAPSAGGIPPRGSDMNGALSMVSAHAAWTAAGGQAQFNQAVIDEVGGYGVGQILQSVVNPTQFYLCVVADTTTDPDDDPTGWLTYSPAGTSTALQVIAPVAGPSNDYPINSGIGFVDVNPTSGPANWTGIEAGFDGQMLTVTNIHPTNSFTLNALNGGSLAANQIRMPADITLLQYGSVNLRYSTALALWVGTP